VTGGDLTALGDALEAGLPGQVRRDEPFAGLTTYRVGGPVAVTVRVSDPAALAAVATAVRARRPPVLVVGRGSNLLVADAGFAGLVVVLDGTFERLELEAASVHAGGAVPLPVVARRSAAAGLTGLEFFVGIPGSVGGAVRMNAGGHGRQTGDVLVEAWVVDLLDDAAPPEGERRDAAGLDLGYRQSAVRPTDVVVAARFVATPDDPAACTARIDDVVRWRREHQPGGANAGSVFRNPPGDAAGRLIDAAGLKGFRVGSAVVSDKHANFFQAGESADDVARLVGEVRRRVADATGITLQAELLMVGFDDRAPEPDVDTSR
jgi:UDP-N-acetylmuramate dehydrogenase